jgi:hypothetical protein
MTGILLPHSFDRVSLQRNLLTVKWSVHGSYKVERGRVNLRRQKDLAPRAGEECHSSLFTSLVPIRLNNSAQERSNIHQR